MTAIHVPGLLTFTIAILVFFAGAGLNRLIEPLQALEHSGAGDGRAARGRGDAARLCRAGRRDQLHARRARHAAALFLHRHRPQRQARRPHFRRPSAPDPAGSDAGLSGHPESDRRRQRRRARSAQGHHGVRRLRLADRRARHHDRLGADHHRALRARQCARSRHRDRDARAWSSRASSAVRSPAFSSRVIISADHRRPTRSSACPTTPPKSRSTISAMSAFCARCWCSMR